MDQNFLEMPANSKNLFLLANSHYLTSEELERSYEITEKVPTTAHWKLFIDYFCLVLGVAFGICGLFFFFAFNWSKIHHFAKLGTGQFFLILAVFIALYKGIHSLVGHISLVGASFLVGANLALYGQIYQTQADSYTLFLTWAFLIFGWVCIGKSLFLCCEFLVLLNTSFILYCEQVMPFGETSESIYFLFWVLFFLNSIALFTLEFFHFKWKRNWCQNRWLAHFISVFILIFTAFPVVTYIFSDLEQFADTGFFSFIFYLSYILTVFYYYSQKYVDMFILASSCLSLIFIVTAIAIRISSDIFGFGEIFFFMIFFIILLQANIAVNLLRYISKLKKGTFHSQNNLGESSL